MAVPSSSTVNWDAVATTTLNNYQGEIVDQISTANPLLYYLIREEDDAYEGESSLGVQVQIELMYGLGRFDSFSGYDPLQTTPTDGITAALWPWRQGAIPIMISRLEERQNSGDHRVENLLKNKVKQATMGIHEGYARSLMQGEGYNNPTVAGNIEAAYISPSNGSVFIDPLPLLIKKDPTTSTSIGNINQSTYSWWRNKSTEDTSTTFAGHLKFLAKLFNDCSKGPMGSPTILLGDQSMFELYEAALRSQNRFVETRKADIPFDNITFRGKPYMWDEWVPNVEDRVVAQVTTKGSVYMINTKCWKIKYDKQTNFYTTPFERPTGQDAKVAHIMWYGANCVSNRRKQGVGWGTDTTIAS